MPPGLELIPRYFPEISSAQLSQFEKLWPLYQEWNAKINVISRKDIDELYVKHVLHSLAIAKVKHFKPGTRILDVGTGGGFPGIPLAIYFPESAFHLVDSIHKKIKVVEEIVKGIGLKNVTFEHQRAEKVKGKFDYVVSRAVTQMKPFTHWVQQKIIPGPESGIYYLKGGDLLEEMSEIKYAWNEYPISKYLAEPFFETKKVVFVKIP